MNLIEVESYQEMSERACKLIIETVKKLNKPVLGLATGSTPEKVYTSLQKEYAKGTVSFQQTRTYNLDEYVGLSRDDPHSYRYYMNDKLFNHIDIPKNQTHIPHGDAPDLEAECERYENLLRQDDEIDLQLLGLGENGHIGFNEPGTPFDTKTHVVNLAESTREANARFFNSLEEVPKQAITMGISTILQSRHILLIVSGTRKQEALDRLLNGGISEDFPASVLQRHPNVTVIADKDALGKTS